MADTLEALPAVLYWGGFVTAAAGMTIFTLSWMLRPPDEPSIYDDLAGVGLLAMLLGLPFSLAPRRRR